MNLVKIENTELNITEFKTMTPALIQKINDWLPEVSRGTNIFSKTNSQTSASLMTLTMLECGPYRTLRQILAQVSKKKMALKEAGYSHAMKDIEYQELEQKLETLEVGSLAGRKIQLEMAKIKFDMQDSMASIENSLKEIGAYKCRYEEIIKNNNIPENWDELDFEEAEIKHHLCSIFRNAVRDRLQGAPNQGTMEYMEQMGLNPITAYALVDQYIGQCRQSLNEGKGPDINAHYNFFDQMYELFKDEYKKAMKRIGLDSITHAEYLMKENS